MLTLGLIKRNVSSSNALSCVSYGETMTCNPRECLIGVGGWVVGP